MNADTLADFIRGVLHEEIDAAVPVDLMPMQGSGRNAGGVRLIFGADRDWPSFSLARLGCHNVLCRLPGTPETDAFRAGSWRARSLIYKKPADLEKDLAAFGYEPGAILNTCQLAAPFFE